MDIYDVSDDLVKKLNEWKLIGIISGKFNELKENYAKVNFVERALVDFKYIEKIYLKVRLREDKCNKKSSEFRMLGNEQYLKKRKYFYALELYNKSICYSEPGSENLAIGYANRSAVLFEWKRYRECLANIELARKANYPARLIQKLDKRERECQALLATQPPDIVPFDFKMTFAPHPQLPTIADCLELRETAEEGRYISTTRDLVVGDLVATEKPFCASLLPPMRYIRCATCKRELLTLIPCENCCAAMFCTEACRTSAMNGFHKYECPIIDLLHTLFNKIHGIALRTTLTALDLFPSIVELMSYCEQQENQHKSAFDLDYTQLTPQEHYRAIHGLVTNRHLRSVSDLFQRSVVCATLKHFIVEYTPLKEFLGDGEEGLNFFTELLFRHLQTSPSNMHGVDLVEQVNETKDDQSHSSGAYAFFSLLNHSCAPNTLRIYEGTKAYLFVLRPIKAGEILYDNYGPHFAVFTKKQRIETLSMQYRFTCKCEACEKDYPTYKNLPHKPHIPLVNDEFDMKSLTAFDYQFAVDNYRKYCEFLTKYTLDYPCHQISSAEECLKMALHIMVDAVPLKAKN